MSGKTLGQIGYEAYCRHVDRISPPPWEHLHSGYQDGWQEVANTIAAHAAGPTADFDSAAEITRLRDERDKLQRACITLGWVVDGMARSLRAAWIDIRQGDLKGAAQWVLNSVPDVDDNEPEDRWNGTETSQAWFDRTPLEPLASRTADVGKTGPKPAPGLAAATGEARAMRERLDAIRKLCEARIRVVGMVDGKGVARKVIAIIDKPEGQ